MVDTAAVDGLLYSTTATIPNSVGYFKTIGAAAAVSTTDQIMPQPQDGTVSGLNVTVLTGPTRLVFTFPNGDVFTLDLAADYAGVTPAIVGSTGDDTVVLSPNVLEFTDVIVDLGDGTDALTFSAYTGTCDLDTVEQRLTTPPVGVGHEDRGEGGGVEALEHPGAGAGQVSGGGGHRQSGARDCLLARDSRG